ncbi:MAG TPA: Crp/Fnr family transcriptional regulator [Candidatus Binataceae bacterium]|nr:Crp/Fnr family transcriptional regulator [Candidatus Binataceae bacterium]
MTEITEKDSERNFAAQLEARIAAWGIPKELVKGLTDFHTKISFAPGEIIFRQGSSADILFWVVKGIVKETCTGSNGSRIVVRLLTVGEPLGIADQLNENGQWIRQFDAQAVNKCVLAIITREQVRKLIRTLDHDALLELSERMNSRWAHWVQYYAEFLGMTFRERLDLVLAELGRKFGVSDSDGILLTYEPGHSDLAEMIGSSRPMVSRLMSDSMREGEIARRGPRYILLKGGTINAAALRDPRFVSGPRAPIDIIHSGKGSQAAA